MTDSSTNPPSDDRGDEPLSQGAAGQQGSAPHEDPATSAGDGGSAAASLLESLREAIDDMTERATPTVREVSARVAELTASAASKAAPLAKKAGDATADASDKLAERSRHWAAEVREAMSSGSPEAPGASASTATATEAPPTPAVDPAAAHDENGSTPAS